MDNCVVIVADQPTAIARYLEELGQKVFAVGRRPSDVQGELIAQCEAIYWDMTTVVNPYMRHLSRSLLLSVPKNCIRMLDFNLRGVDTALQHVVMQSLKCCDLLKIDQPEFQQVCTMVGVYTGHLFDSGFELMARFGIKTLILTHDTRGCHVFHGNTVSEQWGTADLGSTQWAEAESAFLAAYYVASRQPGRPFSESHRMALDFMRQLYIKCYPEKISSPLSNDGR